MVYSIEDKHVTKLLLQKKHNGTKKLLKMLPIKDGPLDLEI